MLFGRNELIQMYIFVHVLHKSSTWAKGTKTQVQESESELWRARSWRSLLDQLSTGLRFNLTNFCFWIKNPSCDRSGMKAACSSRSLAPSAMLRCESEKFFHSLVVWKHLTYFFLLEFNAALKRRQQKAEWGEGGVDLTDAASCHIQA